MNPITLIAILYIKEDSNNELLATLKAFVHESQKERDNIEYKLFADKETPYRYVIFEKWASADGLLQHEQSNHYKTFIKQHEHNLTKVEIIHIREIE